MKVFDKMRPSGSVPEHPSSDGDSNSVIDSASTDDSHCTEQAQSIATSEPERLITKDLTRAVNRARVFVLVVIFICAAALGTVAYFLALNNETQRFQTQYNDYANQIIELVHLEARNLFAAVDSFCITIASFANATASSNYWPNVTVPHFDLQGESNNRLSKALQVTFAPLVTVENKAQWEAYSVANQAWLDESWQMSQQDHMLATDVPPRIPSQIWKYSDGDTGKPVSQTGSGAQFGPANYAPVWQQAPAPSLDTSIINYDLLSHPVFNRVYHGMWESGLPVLSEVTDLEFLYGSAVQDDFEHPHSFLLSPIFPTGFAEDQHGQDDLVAFLVAVISWDTYFANLLPAGVNGYVLVMRNTCGDNFTYQINGPDAVFLGKGDRHNANYNNMEATTEFAPFFQQNISKKHEHCGYHLHIYPSAMVEAEYKTNGPYLYMACVVLVFIFIAMVFLVYDSIVRRRQRTIEAKARCTNAIVSSLFPSNVRDRILSDHRKKVEQDRNERRDSTSGAAPKVRLQTFLDEENNENTAFGLGEENSDIMAYETKPIADLFLETTVLFADIVGFTAWSSVREPTQVFTLLETLYHAFDEIAKRRRVFKVETVGDCYVAVTGLPEPRKDHAVVMARFARECRNKMNGLVKKLEVSLGPGTGDLSMRFGLHSGPVTAGVLRGDKSRFQLFGDTVNTASRIESSGERNLIHLSEETANLLVAAGKQHWITARNEKVHAKGKGEMQTYWLTRLQSGTSRSTCSVSDDETSTSTSNLSDTRFSEAGRRMRNGSNASIVDDKIQRLVDWNTDVLARLLRQVVARRRASEAWRSEHLTEDALRKSGETVLDEVLEIIHLPEYDARASGNHVDPDSIVLGEIVMNQLRDYVLNIATMYRENPFHNFEHASHVTMSVVKLLSRIVAPDIVVKEEESDDAKLHDHTYGITSDPLTQFACVYAALIHDVDHAGVPNVQLVKEGAEIAKVYKGQSIAEQNSVDVAWYLLMQNRYSELRLTIYSNEDEQRRFRQLVVNSVMATDIIDPKLKELRNARWDKAFQERPSGESAKDTVNRKATIVIEHLIQASDVAHTMQHWHVYRKWNERLFHEMYKAYKEGRAEKDPSIGWYQGELAFFDFYIISLAKKLKDCGVFGVSGDEYLNYAQRNREEWERRGLEVVEGMVEKYREEHIDHEVRLDEVQDEEHVQLRSELLRTETSYDSF